MFTYNDFSNNRTIKRLRKRYGKPAYAFNRGKLELIKPKRYLKRSEYAYIENTPSSYKLVEGSSQGILVNMGFFIKENFAISYFLIPLYRRFFDERGSLESQNNSNLEIDLLILKELLMMMQSTSSKFYITEFVSPANPRLSNLIDLKKEMRIEYLDLYPFFSQPLTEYHWKHDHHWNELGHKTAALGLFEELKESVCTEEDTE